MDLHPRKKSLLLAALMLAAALPGTAARKHNSASAGDQAPASALTYGLKLTPAEMTLRQGATLAQRQKEIVRVVFTVTDTAAQDWSGQFDSAQQIDIALYRAGDSPSAKPVWRWSSGKTFVAMVMPITIAAGNTWSNTQLLRPAVDGVPAGHYRVVEIFRATGGEAQADLLLQPES